MKFELNKMIRPHLQGFSAYEALRETGMFASPVLLEANENPYGIYNRYPDSKNSALKEKISGIKNIPTKNLFLGNGSDELIDLIIRTFCEPGKDKVFVTDPSFAMYSLYAKMNNVEVVKIKTDENFQIIRDDYLKKIKDSGAKVLFLCSPNNPTGNSLNDIQFYIKNFSGIVVADEAYIEFSKQPSCKALLPQYPNLIVLHTLSKAYGMAGLRLGIGMASEDIASWMNTLKPPYNISSVSMENALKGLENQTQYEENLHLILAERERVLNELLKISAIKKVFETEANFFLIELTDVQKAYATLLEANILTSMRHPSIPGCIRINIGTLEENNLLLQTLKKL